MPDLPIRLAWHQDRMVGVLAASQPLNHTCWIRLGAVYGRTETEIILGSLWQELAGELRQRATQAVYLLAVNDWLAHYVPALGFETRETVITLIRSGWDLPPSPGHNAAIRAASEDDLAAMLAIDNAAFMPPWQLNPGELRQAFRIADHCSIAIHDGSAIGYQLSTLYHATGHLARLAVLPEYQGTGVGGLLMEDLVRRFWRRSVQSVTVNTQASNLRSQRLYIRYGFRRNGYDLAVWESSL